MICVQRVLASVFTYSQVRLKLDKRHSCHGSGTESAELPLAQTTTMARAGLTFFALFAILFAVYFEFSLKARISSSGVWRKVEPVGNTNCKKVETLQACESV